MNETFMHVVGNLAADPELRITSTGKQLCHFRVAQSRSYKGADGRYADASTSFWDVTCWDTLAANVAASVRRGDPVIVQGHIDIEQWSDAEGKTHRRARLTARSVGPDLTWGQSRFKRLSRAQALGLDHNPDEIARAQVIAPRLAAVPDEPAPLSAPSSAPLSASLSASLSGPRPYAGQAPAASGPEPDDTAMAGELDDDIVDGAGTGADDPWQVTGQGEAEPSDHYAEDLAAERAERSA